MRLTPPTFPIFLVSIVLAALAIVDLFTHVPSIHALISAHRFWILAGAYGVLLVGVLFPGL